MRIYQELERQLESEPKSNDCGVDEQSTRMACANCSCGLKDSSDGNIKNIKTSSCGSCYLGDAFRCDGCPYKGLPAFSQDELIKLRNNAELTVPIDEVKITNQTGKIKLNLD